MPLRGRYPHKKHTGRSIKSRRRLKRMEVMVINSAALILLTICALFLKDAIFSPKKNARFPLETVAAFQIPNKTMFDLAALAEKYSLSFSELLTLYCFDNNFFPSKTIAPTPIEIEQRFIKNYDDLKDQYAKKDMKPYITLFNSILANMVYFPIPVNYDLNGDSGYMYGDSWDNAQKKLIGASLFPGANIVDRENMAGLIPVVSVSGGTVTQCGWNDTSGFTISVRTQDGISFTYAHLDRFAENVPKGTFVTAGQLIGYMGNSGVKKAEKNGLNHQVHLRFGIFVESGVLGKSFWINPYPFLSIKEANKVDFMPPEQTEVTAD